MTFFEGLFRIIIPISFLWLASLLRRHQDDNPPEISSEFVYQEWRLISLFGRLFLPLLTPLLLLTWVFGPTEEAAQGIFIVLLGSALFTSLSFAFLYYMEFSGAGTLTLLSGLGTVGILLFGLIFQFTGFPLFSWRLLPPLLIVVAPPILTIVLLYLWAPKILPLSEEDQRTQRKKALQLILSLFTGYPKKVVGVENGELKTYINGNSFQGSGPGLVVTEPENLVALRSGAQIQRIVGPGTVFTGRAEVPFAVVDLMKQFRVEKVKALTRDGIAVRAPCSSIFRIDWGGQNPTLNQPWPHRKSAVYLAYFGGMEVNPEGKDFLTEHKPDPWKELPLRTAKQQLKRVIAGYSLDELYGSLGAAGQPLPRQLLTQKMRSFTEARMKEYGIEIIGGSVGNRIEPVNEEIQKKHVETWKAKWARQIIMGKSKRDAEYLRQLGRVRGRVINEMLLDLIEQAKVHKEVDNEMTLTFLGLHFLQMLEDIARDPQVEPLLPETTMAFLRQRKEEKREKESE
jgi:hypothetical protein